MKTKTPSPAADKAATPKPAVAKKTRVPKPKAEPKRAEIPSLADARDRLLAGLRKRHETVRAYAIREVEHAQESGQTRAEIMETLPEQVAAEFTAAGYTVVNSPNGFHVISWPMPSDPR